MMALPSVDFALTNGGFGVPDRDETDEATDVDKRPS